MIRRSIIFFALVSLFSGCLTYEKRVFEYTVNDDGSVDLLITYYDICSANFGEIETDSSFIEKDDREPFPEDMKDYNSLIGDYYVSEYFSMCFPGGTVQKRLLYQENDKLNGKVSIHFENMAAAGFHTVKKNVELSSQHLCDFNAFSDTVHVPVNKVTLTDTSNGEWNMSYTFSWKKKEKKMIIETGPMYVLGNSSSLLERFLKDK